MKLNEARKLREIIHTAAVSLEDKDASQAAVLFPRLKQNGALIKAGTRINWHGVVKRAAVDLWDTPENTPDSALALWEDLTFKDGIRIIPKVITVGLAFQPGEKGWWNEELYESIHPTANTWTPEEYPPAWKKVEVN
jgi:hypothetical protein